LINYSFNNQYLTPTTIGANQYLVTLRSAPDINWGFNYTSPTTSSLQYGADRSIPFYGSIVDTDPQHLGLTIPFKWGNVPPTNNFDLVGKNPEDYFHNYLAVGEEERWVVCKDVPTKWGKADAVQWVKGEISLESVTWCSPVRIRTTVF